MYLREIGCEVVDWIHLDQDSEKWQILENTVMNLWVPQKVGNFLTSSVTIIFSSRTLHHVVSRLWSLKKEACLISLLFNNCVSKVK
jgi:hypothetical protein